jgi:hypothetical protein
MEQHAPAKQVFTTEPVDKRGPGKPKLRRKDGVEADIPILNLTGSLRDAEPEFNEFVAPFKEEDIRNFK